jgi:hypothetical protein
MQATKSIRNERRADHWLATSGGSDKISDAAFALLVTRLAARRRAFLVSTPLYLLTFGAIASTLFDRPAAGASHVEWVRRTAVAYLAAIVLLTAAKVLAQELVHRSERVMRDRRPDLTDSAVNNSVGLVSAPVLLGRARSVVAIIALALSAILGLVSVWLHPGVAGWIYLAAIGATCWLVRRGLTRTSRRSTIAVDRDSQLIDARLRSVDCLEATTPIYPLLFAFGSQLLLGTTSAALLAPWIASILFITGVSVWARFGRPGQQTMPRPPTALPTASAPHRPRPHPAHI